MTIPVTGGCQCGAHRYAAQIDLDGYWCHCRMCQRAVGNVAAALVNAQKADVRWLGAPPATIMSSPIGRRGFCAQCGTPLTFDYPDSDKMDLTVGSLDDPAAVQLTSHFGTESRVPGWTSHDDLPSMRADEYQPLAERWANAGESPR